MSAPAKPLYLGPSGSQPQPSLVSWIWNEQIANPAHREGNIAIARAVGLFVAGVLFVRSDLSAALVPVF
ncbi:uncharacterized protein LOC62_02G002055 [Vanrija pseudolonga]|uniref:Uncharacterized protein n=1 Tax=Vanrija pseudolonga TaxID=143232 RepID=A0AAF1BNU9_9TREE|nr:hypothetical protein LOC62_02G002055 [Vanrija pseudolonga]